MAVVVLGASGRTGRLIVSHVFAAGNPVVAVVRRADVASSVTGLGRPTGPGALDDTTPISRQDVAAVVGSSLFFDLTAGCEFAITGGSTPLLQASQTLLAAPSD